MGLFPNPIDAFKNTVDFVEDTTKTVVNTTETVVSTSLEVSKTAAISSFGFQGAMAKIALQKTWTITQTGFGILEKGFDALSHPGSPNPPASQGLKFVETKDACQLAYKGSNSKIGNVYRFADGKLWKVVDIKNDNGSGFRAIALKPVNPNDKRVVVAFSGSDGGNDWDDNLKQGAGLPTKQYSQAVAFANKWKTAAGGNVILTGHSLGGGLASYASIKLNLRATAINSAPLALDHLGLNPFDARRITQYYVPGEVLSDVNKANPLDVRPGFNIPIQGRYPIYNPIAIYQNHLLPNVTPNIGDPTLVR